MVIETDLKLIKNTFAAKEIKPNAETFGKADRCSDFPFADFDGEIMKIDWNKTAISNNNHLLLASLPLNTYTFSLFGIDNIISRAGINIYPKNMPQNIDWDNGHQVSLMRYIGKFYKRQAISSSRGTLNTDGIFLGSISLAFFSTSILVSPTAASCSFTTATYLPAYFSTSSLKCSTIQRSSLSIVFSYYLWGCCFFSCRQTRNAIKPAKPMRSKAKIKKESASLTYKSLFHVSFSL